MAESMLDIRRHIKSITGTQHITNAMKLVSAAKFKKSKDRMDDSDARITMILGEIGDVFSSVKHMPDMYVEREGEETPKDDCYIVIASNKGLCGSFNANIIRTVDEFIRGKDEVSKPHIISLGSKGEERFRAEGLDIKRSFDFHTEMMSLEDVQGIVSDVMDLFKNGDIDELYLAYTHFINSMEVVPTVEKILPLDLNELGRCKSTGNEGEYKGKVAGTVHFDDEVEIGPSEEELFSYLLPRYVELKLYRAIIESAAAEHIARRNAMDTATDNANEMLKNLNLKYNRARQAGITNELIEIVSGAEALK